MSGPQHTPGPWSVVNGDIIRVAAKERDNCQVCTVTLWSPSGPNRPQALADACLVAAAPDLLAELERCDMPPQLDVDGALAILSYLAAAVTIALTVAALVVSPIAWWVL